METVRTEQFLEWLRSAGIVFPESATRVVIHLYPHSVVEIVVNMHVTDDMVKTVPSPELLSAKATILTDVKVVSDD